MTGIEGVRDFGAWNEVNLARFNDAPREGAETIESDGLVLDVDDVTDVLCEGAPEAIENHEGILLTLQDSRLHITLPLWAAFLLKIATDFPDVVAQLDARLFVQSAKVWQGPRLIESLLDDKFLEFDFVHD